MKTITEILTENPQLLKRSRNSSPEIRALEDLEELIQSSFHHLNELLDEKKKKALDAYRNCTEEYLQLCTEQSFCDGFNLGVKLTAEAFVSQNE